LLFADAENANLIDASLTAAGNFFFAMLAILMIMAILRNKESSITFGSALIILSTALYFLISIIRGISAIYGPGVIFVDVRMADVSGSTIIIVAAVTVHIGFIVMMFEQMHRTQLNSVEQSARADEGRLQAEKRQLEVQRLSEEQKALIEVLTHEVRQPLNNASAALQSITHELDGNRAPRQMEAVLRAQSVIDNVSTALSNALVAATILERQHKFYPARCEPVAIAQIVALDFSLSDRKRIEIEAAQAPLFMTADPILIRIALRNLFENALRYAPAGSQILIEICADETKMGVAFNVSNEETNPKWADGVDIFARRVRGANPQISGSGMGLYIAAEIAKLHNGALTTHGTDGRRIFSLFLSD
jgi:K+-sensing histidine kinase KdpD